jgi:hypothetical protein
MISSEPMVAPEILFVLWIVLTLLTNLPDPYYLLGNLDIVPILIVQSYIIKLNCENGCEGFVDNKLTPQNWLAIAAGILANAVVLIISLKLG